MTKKDIEERIKELEDYMIKYTIGARMLPHYQGLIELNKRLLEIF